MCACTFQWQILITCHRQKCSSVAIAAIVRQAFDKGKYLMASCAQPCACPLHGRSEATFQHGGKRKSGLRSFLVRVAYRPPNLLQTLDIKLRPMWRYYGCKIIHLDCWRQHECAMHHCFWVQGHGDCGFLPMYVYENVFKCKKSKYRNGKYLGSCACGNVWGLWTWRGIEEQMLPPLRKQIDLDWIVSFLGHEALPSTGN